MVLKALVVDNNPVLLKAISVIVEKEGPCQVHTAKDGLQALDILKTVKPDIIFSDLVMPLVDGELLCKIIRHNPALRDTRIVIVSAVPLEQTQRIMQELDCDYCIVKGSLKELRLHIREVFKWLGAKEDRSEKIVRSSAGKKSPGALVQTITAEILHEKRHREEIVAYLSEGVVEMNDQGKIVEINNAALDILQVTKERVIGSTLDSLGWGQHTRAVTEWLRRELTGKRVAPLNIVEKNPIFRQGKVLTATFLAIEGTSYFGICIVRDITRLYRAEEYKRKLEDGLRLVKKMEAMSGMAGGVAHDFNNLLTILCGNIEMANTALLDGSLDKVDYLLDQAQKSAQAAVALTTKISHFSPYGIISRENHETGVFLRNAIETFRGPRQLTFAFEPGSEPLFISIDHAQMTTALHNVFTNCAESGTDSAIALSTEKTSLKQPLLEGGKYVPAGTYMTLSVSDNGRGIEPRHLVEVFDPYFSTKKRGNAKGMGLGLAVVYSTVRNHGGYVTVDSVVGHGTTVSFFLPLVPKPADDVLYPADDVNFSIGKILLIEEDEQSRQVARVMLEHLGVAVMVAPDRDGAIDLITSNLKSKETISAVLINLPGEDPEAGFLTCQEIKLIASDVPVIAVCGSSVIPVMNNFGSSGFMNFLPKPYTVEDLKNILSTITHNRQDPAAI